jgi:hypothetical protein
LQGSESFKISGSCHQVVGFLSFANSWKGNPRQVGTWQLSTESQRLHNKTKQLITSDHNAQWLLNHWSKFNITNQKLKTNNRQSLEGIKPFKLPIAS